MARASSALLKRRLDIAEIVRKQGEVKVDELSAILNVSGVTIRQDLTYLEQQGYLKRSFGGAIYIAPEVSINHSRNQIQSQLQNSYDNSDIDMVKQCLDYIHDGDTLFLNHGCLIRKLIPFLYAKKSLTLIMNDLANAVLAKEFTQAEVIIAGGTLSDNKIVEDNQLLSMILSQYPITQCIIEAVGINSDNEIIIESAELVKSYRQLIKNVDHAIVVLPQRIMHDETNSIGKLKDIDIAILSRSNVTEYHQQLLDCYFKQISSGKNSIIYHNSLEA